MLCEGASFLYLSAPYSQKILPLKSSQQQVAKTNKEGHYALRNTLLYVEGVFDYINETYSRPFFSLF